MKSLSHSLFAVLFFCFALSQTTFLQGQTLGGGILKANLDLPFDAGLLNDDTEDEDAPEIITFYSQQYEGDGIFYTIDRSGTMQDRGELTIAKREIRRNIIELSGRVQFGIVFFDRGIMKFPGNGRPTEADAAMKSSALSWLQSVQGGGGSCCQQGLVEALKFANASSSARKVVLYVGDGGGTCAASGQGEDAYLQKTLAVVKSQNFQRAQVNAIGVLMQGRQRQEQFLKALAAGNGGTYVNKSQ